MFKNLEEKDFQVQCLSHAAAILEHDFPEALTELERAFEDFEIPITEIIGSGGGEAQGTQRLRRALSSQEWVKTNFEISKVINGVTRESISHEIDHVRAFPSAGVVALEIEWNNKDPFFDRDLENFKRLHAEGAISVGVIVTRGATLQAEMRNLVGRFAQERGVSSFEALEALGYKEHTKRQKDAVMKRVNRERLPLTFEEAWTDHFVADKFGAATTHWSKLMDRVSRGVGNPCPLVLIGLPASVVTFDPDSKIEVLDGEEAPLGE